MSESFTHSHVVLYLYDIISYVEHKRRYYIHKKNQRCPNNIGLDLDLNIGFHSLDQKKKRIIFYIYFVFHKRMK